MPFHEEISLASVDELLDALESLPSSAYNWLFRGHGDSSWTLTSTLERSLVGRFGVPYSQLPDMERALVRSFQRGCHLYVPSPPLSAELVEWWALMQHYGAPTRLTDWTYSYFVALYFALADSIPHRPCAIWAVDLLKLVETVRTLMSDEAVAAFERDPRAKQLRTVETIFASGALIFPLNPYRLNERLRLHQGIFLAASDLEQPFQRNLEAVMAAVDDSEAMFKKFVFEMDGSELKHALMRLRRMNITAETLFPGIDGFARSLNQKIAVRELEISLGGIALPSDESDEEL